MYTFSVFLLRDQLFSLSSVTSFRLYSAPDLNKGDLDHLTKIDIDICIEYLLQLFSLDSD